MTIDEIMKLTGASRMTIYRWRKRFTDFPSLDQDVSELRKWWSINEGKVGRWPQEGET